MMKILKFIGILLSAAILFTACEKENNDLSKKALLEFKCYNPLVSDLKSTQGKKLTQDNPDLLGDTTEVDMISIKWTIGDVWVSQGEVQEGDEDKLEWIRLTDETNTTMKLFEEYSFPAKEIPAGEYKSVKITFRNVFYRQVKAVSDPFPVYYLLETMGSREDACDPDDTSWARTNYFSTGGNFYLDENDKFKSANPNEKVGGFTLEEGKKANLYWRLGAGATEKCRFFLIDKNGNRQWDCGIDKLDVEVPENFVEAMWDFVVEYVE